MADTVTSPETRTPEYRDYGGRTRAYGVVGFLLLLALLGAIGLAYFQVEGPNLVLLDVAVWVLALVVFMIALCLMYVLFTLRGALRQVRAQATEVAVVRALAHRHEILEPARPTPSVEYATPASEPAPLPAPSYTAPMVPSRNVEVIEGIGPVFARRLARAGIETLRDLRAATADQIADASQAPRAVVDRWKAMADLMVVREVGPQAAELLVACSVYSVEGLSAQDPETLRRRCLSANKRGENRIMPSDITTEMVAGWVKAARRHGTDGATYATPRGSNEAAMQAEAAE